jgi:hypothetical protein
MSDVFNYSAWITRYPEFSTVNQSTAALYFAEAGLYLNKRVSGNNRALYLSMITAHIAALYSGVNGNAPSGTVGRVSNATQGSVSVGMEYKAPGSDLAAWFNQTPYGAQVWSALSGYRTARYIPGHSEPHYLTGQSGYVDQH